MTNTPPTTLFIVRHGETVWNIEQRLQGHLDSPLTELGIAQAEATAERLVEENLEILYSSDSGRAMVTAQAIAERAGLEVLPDAGLRERNLGVFQGLTYAEAEAKYPEEITRVKDIDFVIPEGESARQKEERGIAAIETIAQRHPGKKIGIVTHGGIVGSLLRRVMHVPDDAPTGFMTHNGSIGIFQMDNGTLRLSTWGDIRHLRNIGTKDDF